MRNVYPLFIPDSLNIPRDTMIFANRPDKREQSDALTSRFPRRDYVSSNSSSWKTVRQPPKTTVLVADKNKHFTSMLSHSLRARDFDCVVADSRKSIVSIFAERKPRIVVLSFGIEKEKDGMDAAKDILNISSRTAVIVLTDADSKVGDRIERLGVEIFMPKDSGFSKIVNSICAVSNLRKSSCDLVAR